MVFPESFCTLVLCLKGENRQKCQPEKSDQVDRIQGSMGSLQSGKTSFKEDTGKKRPKPSEPSSTSSAMLKKRENLEDFGFQRGSSESKRPKVEALKLFSSFTNETPTGLLSKSPNLQKQANKEKVSTIRQFNRKWKRNFPGTCSMLEKKMMICNLHSANSGVAGTYFTC